MLDDRPRRGRRRRLRCALRYRGRRAAELAQAQSAVNKGLATLQGEAALAPGWLGKRLAKPFGKSEKATNKSARAGRKTRFKLPF